MRRRAVRSAAVILTGALAGIAMQASTGHREGNIDAIASATRHGENDAAVRAVTRGAVGTTWLLTVRWKSDLEPERWYVMPDDRGRWRAIASSRGYRGLSGIEEAIARELDSRIDDNAVQVDGGSSGTVTIAYNLMGRVRTPFRPVRVWVAAESGGDVLAVAAAKVRSDERARDTGL